jgi:hypothetical protein
MVDKKKRAAAIKLPESPPTPAGEIKKPQMQIQSIFSINGKFKAKLVNINEDGWICEIWERNVGGRDRPRIRNVRPFATMEEAIEMARTCFREFTGDDRYFAGEDVRKENKTGV